MLEAFPSLAEYEPTFCLRNGKFCRQTYSHGLATIPLMSFESLTHGHFPHPRSLFSSFLSLSRNSLVSREHALAQWGAKLKSWRRDTLEERRDEARRDGIGTGRAAGRTTSTCATLHPSLSLSLVCACSLSLRFRSSSLCPSLHAAAAADVDAAAIDVRFRRQPD